jgi:glycosyltransferase involved in cell wall biosynthesis
MRITIDAVPLLLRSSGVKSYLYYWTRCLMRRAEGVDIRLFPLLGEPSVLNHEGSVADAAPTLARLSIVRALNRLGGVGSRFLLSGTDVFHAATLMNPPRGLKLTATIYDLTCWIVPETHQQTNINGTYRTAERIWKRADGLIAISESARSDAVRFLKIPERKIRVIYPGVTEAYSLAGSGEADRVRAKLELQRPYLLFVGTVEPRKNVDVLLDAYEALPRSIAQEFELVLAGPRGWANPGTLARLNDPPPNVRYLGYVAEDDLPGLFAGATAFAFPSLYEGFGFPVAQALAAGVPVITSAGSSLGEITAGAARLVDPRSTAELRDAIADLLTSPGSRSTLSELGRIQGARFSWEVCARQSIDFFQTVAGGSL